MKLNPKEYDLSKCAPSVGRPSILARTLFPDGVGCSGQKCQSNDHSNGDRDYTPHANHPQVCKDNPETCTGAKHWHEDGGYAFQHRWI